MPIDENGDEYEVVASGMFPVGKVEGDPVEPIGKIKQIVDHIKDVLKDREIQCINRGDKIFDTGQEDEKEHDVIFVTDSDNNWIATIIDDEVQDSVFPF